MEIDKMHHRLKEILFNEQNKLTKSDKPHGDVYFFSREINSRKGLRPIHLTPHLRNSATATRKLNELFENHKLTKPQLRIIAGKAGIGMLKKLIGCKFQFSFLFSLQEKHIGSILRSKLLKLYVSVLMID